MKARGFGPFALVTSVAGALLPGCGGSRAPVGAPGAMPQSVAVRSLTPQRSAARAQQRSGGGSWMLPEARHDDLLYVSDFYGVHVFSYPKLKPVGQLDAGSSGMCSDRDGNVFFTHTEGNEVTEYAHGGTQPIQTFYDDTVELSPWDCSVDPSTNNLAIAPLDASYVVIFPHEKNKPHVYYDPGASAGWCAYDARGNLYLDQVVASHRRRFEEIGVLKKGTTTFKNYRLDHSFAAGGLQFDGRHIVVGNLQTNTLYRLRFAGSNATVIGSTQLGTVQYVQQFWIFDRRVIAADLDGNSTYIWRYPAGGPPVTSIEAFFMPQGSTISAGS